MGLCIQKAHPSTSREIRALPSIPQFECSKFQTVFEKKKPKDQQKIHAMNIAARRLFPTMGTRILPGQFLMPSRPHHPPQRRRMTTASSYGRDNTADCCYGPTMDDLPVPHGCWFAAHARTQRSYTIWMAVGVLYLAVSVSLAMQAFSFDAYPERSIRLMPEDFESSE